MIKEEEKGVSVDKVSKSSKGRRVKVVRSEDVCVWDRGKIGISSSNLSAWLRQEGFYYDEGLYYKSDGNVLDVCDKRYIREYIEEELFKVRNKSGKVIREYSMHLAYFEDRITSYINDAKLQLLLNGLSGNMVRDNEYESYFAFSNGIVVVRRDSIEVKRYEEVLDSSRVLMRDKIIGREVSIVSKEEALSSDFADFCLRAMSDGKASGNSVGLSCLMSAMGYIMSGYKNPALAKMVFFSDCNNADGIANGRTGKSLCAKVALSQVRKLAVVDGKQFNTMDKFMLENVDESTDIVCLQDMRSNFNKETLYNAITGNFEIGKKYKAKEVIPFSRSPKLIADSNFGIKLSGNSDLARFVVIGFSHYWSKDNEPMYRYKKRFFDDWNDNEWDCFYSFMFYCVQEYMNKGLRSYRLDEIMAYSIYERFPYDLVNEVKEILMEKDNILETPHEPNDWWEDISYWKNDPYTKYAERTKTMRMLMNELGYVRYNKKKTLHFKDRKDSATTLYWFERNDRQIKKD